VKVSVFSRCILRVPRVSICVVSLAFKPAPCGGSSKKNSADGKQKGEERIMCRNRDETIAIESIRGREYLRTGHYVSLKAHRTFPTYLRPKYASQSRESSDLPSDRII